MITNLRQIFRDSLQFLWLKDEISTTIRANTSVRLANSSPRCRVRFPPPRWRPSRLRSATAIYRSAGASFSPPFRRASSGGA